MASLLDNVETFRLSLIYEGPEPEKYKSLFLSVGEPIVAEDSLGATPTAGQAAVMANQLRARLTAEQAAVVIGCLAAEDHLLNRLYVSRYVCKLRDTTRPAYRLAVANDEGDVGCVGYIQLAPDPSISRPSPIEQLQPLRAALVGEAAEAMDQLVQALAAAQEPAGSLDTQATEQFVLSTRIAVTSLLDDLSTFSLALTYKGPDPKRHKSVHLSVAQPGESTETSLTARLTAEQAAALIGYLANDGLLYRDSINQPSQLIVPKDPHYIVVAGSGLEDVYAEHVALMPHRLGTRPSAFEQFQSLRAGLMGEASEAVNQLVQDLASDRAIMASLDTRLTGPFVRSTRMAMTSLLDGLSDFSLQLTYRGPDPEKHKSLYLCMVQPMESTETGLTAQLTPEQAAVLVGYLARDGLLYPHSIYRARRRTAPKGPFYLVVARSGHENPYFEYAPLIPEPPGIQPSALEQFQSLRIGLTGEAAEAMDQIVQALSGDEEPPGSLRAEATEQFVSSTRMAVTSLLDDLSTFSFTITYKGPDPKRHKTLHLSVAQPGESTETALAARLTTEQAAALIGYLARDGSLYRGSINREVRLAPPNDPHYIVTATNGRGDEHFEYIPWTAELYGDERLPTMVQFMFLRGGLTGDAGEAIDELLRALAPEQK